MKSVQIRSFFWFLFSCIRTEYEDLSPALLSATCRTEIVYDFLYFFWKWAGWTLCEKCPNREFFLVRIFPYSDWIRRNTSYLSVFSPNRGKYGPERTPYFDTFHTVETFNKLQFFIFGPNQCIYLTHSAL